MDPLRLVPTSVLLFLALVTLAAAVRGRAQPRELSDAVQTGDLVFQRSRSRQAAAIALATESDYTHVGLVVVRDGAPFVLEAEATVRWTPLDAWIARGVDGRFVAKRLRDRASRVSSAAEERMVDVARSFVGAPYDTRFEWSDDRIYCSELVYKIYERGAGIRVGELRRAGDFALGSETVQRLLRRRFGRRGTASFDPEEPVVSPAAVFADPGLVTVVER